MNKIFFGIAYSFFMFSFTQASASEVDLACISESSNVTRIIIGENNVVKTLKVNSETEKTARLKKYAVFVEYQPTGDLYFYLRRSSQFRYERMLVAGIEVETYKVRDLIKKDEYLCVLNTEVDANPALSRSN